MILLTSFSTVIIEVTMWSWQYSPIHHTDQLQSSLAPWISPHLFASLSRLFRIRPESKHQLGTTIPGIHLLANLCISGCWQNSMRSHKPQIAYTCLHQIPLKTCWLCLGSEMSHPSRHYGLSLHALMGTPPWQPISIETIDAVRDGDGFVFSSPSLYPCRPVVRHFVETSGHFWMCAAMLSHLPHLAQLLIGLKGKQ